MIAFVADYAAGQIAVDGSEIIEAAWFSKDKLPQLPPKISIARQLIDWFTQL
jgi:NAD+ diphosphatase